jgi:hypothetical protein
MNSLIATAFFAASVTASLPPTGIGRCCYETGGECLHDKNHCVAACVNGGSQYDCQNCMCWSQSTGCCAENYVCTSTGSPLPLTGQCKPYCSNDCNGHGNCIKPNECSCETGWDSSKNCSTCDATHFGKDCSACPVDNEKVCSGHGICNGAGTNSGTGACACAEGWADNPEDGTKCSICQKGYGPVGKCNTFICSQHCVHGNCTAPNSCTCEEGWSGNSCDTTSCKDITPEGQPECSGNGKCVAPNVCSCDIHFQGLACEISNAECCATISCADNQKQCNNCCHYPKGDAKACANAAYSCKGCDCGVVNGAGTQGCCGSSYCQSKSSDEFSAVTFISNAPIDDLSFRGVNLMAPPGPSYQCCPANRAGLNCKKCASGYFGEKCIPCPGGTPSGTNHNTCSGHGICQMTGKNQGKCECSSGYSGDGCSKCDASKFHCPNNCGGHGACVCPKSSNHSIFTNNTAGTCSCEKGYENDECGECSNGYWNENDDPGGGISCVKCDGCAVCNKKTGSCTSTPSPGGQTPSSKPTPGTPSGTPPLPGKKHTSIATYVMYGVGGGIGCLLIGSAFMWVLKRPQGSSESKSKLLLSGSPMGSSKVHQNNRTGSVSFYYNPPSITGGNPPSITGGDGSNPPSITGGDGSITGTFDDVLSFPDLPDSPE